MRPKYRLVSNSDYYLDVIVFTAVTISAYTLLRRNHNLAKNRRLWLAKFDPQ